MEALLQSLGTHYSKPDTDRRVTFDRATVQEAPPPVEMNHHSPPDTVWDMEKSHNVGDEESQKLNYEEMVSEEVKEREGEIELTHEDGELEKGREQSGEELSARVSFLRPAIAGVCAQCVTSVVGRQSVDHCSLLCTALEMYGGPDTVGVVYRDDQITSLLEEGGGALRENGGSMEGERDTGRQAGAVEMVEEDVAEKREEHSVTEMAVCLSSCLLRAIDSSVISGRDPRLIEGVVSSILHLLQVQGVSKEAAYSTLHKMVQVYALCVIDGD